jgi:hypothetical protein
MKEGNVFDSFQKVLGNSKDFGGEQITLGISM